MSRSAADALIRRLQLREEIEGLELSLRVFRAHDQAGAAATVATSLARARAEKEVLDSKLRQLAGLN